MNNKRKGRKPGSIMRSTLTVCRKLKIAEFKQNDKMYPDRYGIPGSARWNAKLLQYIKDPVLTIDDIERWVRTHSWITAEDEPQRPLRPTRNDRRARSLSREATPTRFQTPRSAGSAFRHPGSNMRLTRQMVSTANQHRRSRSHSSSSASSEDTVVLNRGRNSEKDTDPTYGQQYRNRTPKLVSTRSLKNHNMGPPALEPMVTISPHHIDFGNVVNADNYQRTSSPVPSISQRYFVEDANEMSGIENDNGNPLEPPQNHHTQQWPHVYEGLGRRLIASPAQHTPPQQFMYIPANQMQMQGNGNGNSSQFILPDGSVNNWQHSQVSENNPPPSMNVPEDQPPPFKKTKEDNKSGDMASDLNLGMTALGDLSQICGRHDELRSCLLQVEKIFTVMQRAQKRTVLVLSHKDALAAAVEAKNKKIIKMEIVDDGAVGGRSGTPPENEGNDMDCPIPAEVDLCNE